MPVQTQATQPSGKSETPPPTSAPSSEPAPERAPSIIPEKQAPTPSVVPAGEQAPPAGKTPAESEAPSALIPGSGGNKTTPNVPEDWRSTLPPELKSEPSLGAINSVEDLAKSYVHAQKVLGGPKISVPDPKVATPEDYRAVFKKLGLPEKAEDYKLEVAPDSGLDASFVEKFKENAFNAGILPKHAQELVNWYVEASKEMVTGLTQKQTDELMAEHKNLKSEWGKAYDRKLLATQLVVKDFADDETIGFLKETGLHQHPKMLKFLSRIGESLKEDELKGSAGRGTLTRTPAEALAEANRIMGDTSHPYNVASHPNHGLAVREVEQLFNEAHPEPEKS